MILDQIFVFFHSAIQNLGSIGLRGYGDNKSVLINVSAPESTLKKKSQSVAYHFVLEGCAADEWRTTYLHKSLNISYLMTKPLSGEKRWRFVRMLLHHI